METYRKLSRTPTKRPALPWSMDFLELMSEQKGIFGKLERERVNHFDSISPCSPHFCVYITITRIWFKKRRIPSFSHRKKKEKKKRMITERVKSDWVRRSPMCSGCVIAHLGPICLSRCLSPSVIGGGVGWLWRTNTRMPCITSRKSYWYSIIHFPFVNPPTSRPPRSNEYFKTSKGKI